MSSVAGLSLPPTWAQRRDVLRTRWRGLAARERRLVQLMLAALALLLLWLVLLQPALRVLREAPARLQGLEAQLQLMQQWADEAQQLRATPPLNAEQSSAALKAATDRLGNKARLQLQGDRAIVTLNGVGSGALRDWLAEVRSGARARPVEAQLTRGPQGFNGSVVLNLGGAP